MIKPCKHYKDEVTTTPRGACNLMYDHDPCPFKRTFDSFDVAAELCKKYEPVESPQWAIFVRVIDHEHVYAEPHKICGTWTVQFETREIENYLQISQPFATESDAGRAMPHWMQNVIVRKIDP